ncbi:MAG: LmbE family protein [Pedosphaera sp.]|nr:LmbE family protein [Pedosphaera sp.]
MPAVLAVFAHPDDIEFRAAGTLLLLREAGWDVHYWNICSGNLGSTVMKARQTALVRRRESQTAAARLGAVWYPPFANDLELFYTDANLRRVCAVVRRIQPSIVLTHPPIDYMEDHTICCRLAVTGTFARGVPNYRSNPSGRPTREPLAVYHSAPHGLKGPLGEPYIPGCYVDIGAVHAKKRDSLSCHRSQKEWLDASQGMDSYLVALDEDARVLGRASGKFHLSESWTRHLHLGFGGVDQDPLREVLGPRCAGNRIGRAVKTLK